MDIRDLCTEYLERYDELARFEKQAESFRERALEARAALTDVIQRMKKTVGPVTPMRAVVIQGRVIVIEENHHDPAVNPPTISVLEAS